jgi:hypothetical protein
MVQHRLELGVEGAQRKNKLTSICDELFPEFTQIFTDPNLPTALTMRKRFPTPASFATASLTALQEARGKNRRLSDAKLLELQRLAAQSIGTKDPARIRGLVFEQEQLIAELELIQKHLASLDTELTQIIGYCREGQILTSIPGIGSLQAASIIARIGNIANFDRASQLKSYFGWAPKVTQSGYTLDSARLTPRGQRQMKRDMYLMVWQAIRLKDCEWGKMYERLVPIKCRFNERTLQYVGKGKVMGRVAGQMIAVIFVLLKKDQEALSQCAPGAQPPEPVLYDPEIHRQHRAGHYHPAMQATSHHLIHLPPH